MQLRLVKVAAATALAVSCGGSGTDPINNPRSLNSTTIEVSGYQEPGYFLPASDTLNAGANDSIAIHFLWTEPTDGHDIVWDTVPAGMHLDTVPKRYAGTFDFTLAEGRYAYHCSLHQGQNGVIIVYPPKPPSM